MRRGPEIENSNLAENVLRILMDALIRLHLSHIDFL
jgi:hypothetical protein